MTASNRITAATESSRTVVAAEGLLAVFNDAGVLDPLDVHAATTIARLLGETNEVTQLAAALTVRGTRFGHVCIRPEEIQDTVVVDTPDQESVEDLPWPTPEEWHSALEASPLVGDGTTDHPLVYAEARLYLDRYYRYEELVAHLIQQRTVPPEGGRGVIPTSETELTETVPPEGGRGATPSSETELTETVPPEGGRYRRPEAGGRGVQHSPPTSIAPETRTLLQQLLAPDATATRQLDAAVLALTSRIAVIAGGPGTGKTHTIATMLAALAASDDDFPLVALCAPTGKAAARLGQALADRAADLEAPQITERLGTIEPSTIHRLLGWSWDRGRFAHHERNRLPHRLVIVDEMSMVSLPMAAKLLAAVDDDATVVLVGDPFQLESIEAGTVLADIVGPAVGEEPAGAPTAPIENHVVVLDRVHRFDEDSAIADFADAVRLGNSDVAIEMLRNGHDALRWAEDRSHTEFRALRQSLTDQRARMVRLAGDGDAEEALDALTEMAVLCARRRGPDGVAGWSRDLETALDEQFTGLRWGGEWYPGRPVMITRNDYTQDLYNGDIGICVQTPDGLEVVFAGDGVRRFPPSHLDEHTTVHAMTIHKSQGSQFDEVVVVLPDESSKLLTRELLYTAVTRAQHKVHIVGTEDVVRAAIERSVQRASGLGGRLWG